MLVLEAVAQNLHLMDWVVKVEVETVHHLRAVVVAPELQIKEAVAAVLQDFLVLPVEAEALVF
jgi:hypothetical protein